MSLPALILSAAAAVAAPLPSTRAEVAAERAALEQRFAQDQAECGRQFVVSSCMDEVRQRRHEALAPLVRREHELAAEERRARAAAQARHVQERERAAGRGGARAQERIVALPSRAASSAPRVPRARSPESAEHRQRQAAQQADADAAQRREQALQRQQQMRQRLTEHQAREKRRLKPAAAPLPLPGASAASR